MTQAPALRLPARPSLEQLRKQAKDRLQARRASDLVVTLADTQLEIAREYGFESWPKLAHHVESVLSSQRFEMFDRLATDILAGYHGDDESMRRLIAHYGVSYNIEQLRLRVRSHVDDARVVGATGDPTLDEVRHMLAREYGFDDWTALAAGLAQPPQTSGPSPLGLIAGPPFYRIDWKTNTIEPNPPLSAADWDTVVGVMQEHHLTGIRTPAMTDYAMERLSRLDFVTSIKTDGAQQLTDDGVLHLARMPQLEELDLSGWHSPITDRGLAVVSHLRSLRHFQMSWPQRVTDAGAKHLGACEHLESVNLMGTPTGDETLAALRHKSGLRNLTTGRLVTDAGIPVLHDFPHFKNWHGGEVAYGLTGLEGTPNELTIDGPFTNRGLALLAGLDGLFRLGFFWHAKTFTSDGLASLAALPNLGALSVEGERCDDTAMRYIAAIPRLRTLGAQGTVATDDGFIALSHSSSLEHIWGRECPNLTGRGFAALAALPVLKGLAVSCKHVDDAALSTLPRFPALKFIMPMDVPDEGFRHVGRCEGLEALWAMYCRNTGDVATTHIANLKLKLYYAGKTKITDASLEVLGRMTTLEKLEFWETARVTDAGLPALATLPRLREVSFSGVPRVTRHGLAVFPPRVHVNYGT